MRMRSLGVASIACALACALSACGIKATPQAPSPGASAAAGASLGRGRIDDPRAKSLPCLRATGLPVIQVGSTDLRIGSGTNVATVHFEPTPGAAQADQIAGRSEPAEVIGSALLYPQAAGGDALGRIESCLSAGVKG